MIEITSGAGLLRVNGLSINIYHVEQGQVVLHFFPNDDLPIPALTSQNYNSFGCQINLIPWNGELEYFVWKPERRGKEEGKEGKE